MGEQLPITYHTEGAGRTSALDIMKIAGEPSALQSSTNPTRPFTVNTIAEHLDMLMFCHHLNPAVPEDVQACRISYQSRNDCSADVLHDEGVLSMYPPQIARLWVEIGEVVIRAGKQPIK